LLAPARKTTISAAYRRTTHVPMALVVKQRRNASFLDRSAEGWPVPERELSMIADRKGRLPQLERRRSVPPVLPVDELASLGHGYLLLIDQENPLSSMVRRP